MIKIDFEFETQYGLFRDALYLPEDHALTYAQIQTMKEQRRDSWVENVLASSQVTALAEILEINGEKYQRLETVPPSGAKLLEVNSVWYFKV